MAYTTLDTWQRRWLWGLCACVWLLVALPVAAQSGSVQIIDPANLLGAQRNDVEEAAQQLANEGADVIVVADDHPNAVSAQNQRGSVEQRLQENNVDLINGQIRPNQIVFYVNPVQGYAGTFYGSTWTNQLNPAFSNINDQITRRASDGDLAGGVVAGINATRTTINPPTSPLVYVLAGVAGLAIIGLIAAPIVTRRMNASAALSAARQKATQARRDAGAAIADLGRRMEAARAKAQYDALSYAPADAQRVQALQRKADQLFDEAQAAFNAAEEQTRLQPQMKADQYERLAEQYAQARLLTKQAASALSDAEQLRATLDTQNAASAGPPSI